MEQITKPAITKQSSKGKPLKTTVKTPVRLQKLLGPTKMVVQVSWEVCNKVGGIYTVLSTQARCLNQLLKDNLIYIGPLFYSEEQNLSQDIKATDFAPDISLLPKVRDAAKKAGIPIVIGRWQVPGNPIVVLVDWRPLYSQKNDIYAELWERFGVDSLHAYDDYDDATLFGWQAGRVATLIFNENAGESKTGCVLQAHEWMSGASLLYVKEHLQEVATVFTTHATTVGRSITTNNKQLYAYFDGYHGDQMAEELNVQSKHSMEKAAALQSDCMTTVSSLTDKECLQFLGRKSDVLLPNGFDSSFVKRGGIRQAIRKKARKEMLSVYNALNGSNLTDETIIVSTSGRNDFRCKGFDIFISTIHRLQQIKELKKNVLMVIAVPCWKKEPRQDLCNRLKYKPAIKVFDATGFPPLPLPFITHTLNNMDDDRIMQCIKANDISFDPNQKVHLLFIPSYLDGNDGVFNLKYYDFLTASDYCVYPSYYEPWGYTPLESAAFGIPCLTTNLSGFGQWVNSQVGHQAILSDGVAVLPRTDQNYNECVEATATSIVGISLLSPDEYRSIQESARTLADKAQWKEFIINYLQAYSFAIRKCR